ncbi:hypothetical protein NLU13_8629 [Sarocladium strictum]|uniref:DUF5703 domain-containing protein n=1 Tax=Sarocladium strictum TaxID=5046 RepID=A0AA39L559_SARSR|nr:hypothetical protein NLU13_8629 [Sarocladium strictum]
MVSLSRSLLVALQFCVGVLATLPASYDVVWDKPGVNGSADSMPLGGGDVGLNTWYENGTILMYIAKSGAFDENNSLLKLGRVRLSFDPNPFDDESFEQRLVLNDGYVRYTGRDNATAKIWVDVFNPVVHIEVDSPQKMAVRAAYENWRFQDREIVNEERNQGSWGIYTSKIANGTTYADEIGFHENGVLMSHRNDKLDLWNFQMKQQGLEQYSDSMYNPMRDNEFGILVHSEQLKPGAVTGGHYINTTYKAWNLEAKTPQKSFRISLSMYQAQTASHDEWYKGLKNVTDTAVKNTQAATIAWWHDYWARSYIIINEDRDESDAGFQVGKNYQIWRYLMGCNAKGEWPTKFNGGLWTFDPIHVNVYRPYTPDYRRWGGGTFTAQNQRLLYWPLLRAGDWETMTAQFDFYRRITPNAVLRGQVYQGVDAGYFLEQIDNTGLSNVFEYNAQYYDDDANTPRPSFFPDGELWNVWLNHLQDTANEFADMILQANIYSGYDVKPYLEFIESQLAWFDKFYRKQMQTRTPWPLTGINGNESLVIYPGSGAETYKESYNPVSTLAGLRQVIKDLLLVDEYALQNRTYYTRYLASIPGNTLRQQQGHTCIAPAEAYTRVQNSEVPQLYPVFPWPEYGLGLASNLTHAVNTYLYDTETSSFHGNVGWKQDVIWLARMGFTANATAMTEDRYSPSRVCKFPTFKGPNFDWTPDLNHYGAAAIGLQEQLIQTFAGSDIRLLPAWPDSWDARFKVWAPRKTTVEGTVKAGEMVKLSVQPASRRADVVMGQEGLSA